MLSISRWLNGYGRSCLLMCRTMVLQNRCGRSCPLVNGTGRKRRWALVVYARNIREVAVGEADSVHLECVS